MSENQALIDAGLEMTIEQIDAGQPAAAFLRADARNAAATAAFQAAAGAAYRRVAPAPALSCGLRPAGAASGTRRRARPSWWNGGRRSRPCRPRSSTRNSAGSSRRPGTAQTSPTATGRAPPPEGVPVPAGTWVPAYIGLGSNLDDPAAQLRRLLPSWRSCLPAGWSARSPPVSQCAARAAAAAGLRECRGGCSPGLSRRSCWMHCMAIERAQGRDRSAGPALGCADARPRPAGVR